MKLGVVLALILSGAVLSGAYAIHERQATESVPVMVRVGDTMWTICEREADKYGDTRDIREIIYESNIYSGIKDGGHIEPGQQVLIRIKGAK